jgi:hypothetical protein
MYTSIAEERGRVDIVFANAGVGNQMAPLGSITGEQIDRTFNVNVRGLIFAVQKALPLMHDGASIILNASSASIKGIGSLSVYAASKAAVRSLARSWTTDLKDRSIRVNAITPGYTETSIFETLDWTKEQFEEIKAGITKTIPLGRWAHSEEIAKAAVFFWLLRKAAMWLVSNCSLTAVPFRSEVETHTTISGLYCQVYLTLLRWLGLQLRQIHANQHSRAVHLITAVRLDRLRAGFVGSAARTSVELAIVPQDQKGFHAEHADIQRTINFGSSHLIARIYRGRIGILRLRHFCVLC